MSKISLNPTDKSWALSDFKILFSLKNNKTTIESNENGLICRWALRYRTFTVPLPDHLQNLSIKFIENQVFISRCFKICSTYTNDIRSRLLKKLSVLMPICIANSQEGFSEHFSKSTTN